MFCYIGGFFHWRHINKKHQIGSKHMTFKIRRLSPKNMYSKTTSSPLWFCFFRTAWKMWHLQRQPILMILILQLGVNPLGCSCLTVGQWLSKQTSSSWFEKFSTDILFSTPPYILTQESARAAYQRRSEETSYLGLPNSDVKVMMYTRSFKDHRINWQIISSDMNGINKNTCQYPSV